MAKTIAKSEKSLLQAISEATSGLTGHDLLLEISKRITTNLGIRYCFIAECANEMKTRLRTVIFVDGKKLLDNFEYNTNESGCQMMMNGDTFFLPEGAQKRFPAAKGIEAYIGAPIISPTTGEILGHIAATDPEPVSDEMDQTAVLKIFAARIAAELERMKAEIELKKRNTELEKRLNEIELYDTTLNNIRDQVYWVDKTGKIIHVNESASKQSGYTQEELLRMTVFDINPSITKKEWEDGWKKTRKKLHDVLDTEHKTKEGRTYPVEVINNFLKHNGEEYFCSTVRDIRQRKYDEELLRTVSEATSGHTGKDFLIELAKHITITLSMKHALITECANAEKTMLRTLCYTDGEKVLDNIEYSTADIPCEIIMQGKDFFMARDVQKAFPKEKGIESYVGVPIYSPVSDEVIGHIIAVDPNPVTSDRNQTAILKIFAARAGAEIERMKAEEKLKIANAELEILLKESDQRFRDLFEEAPIAYVHEGLDSKFIKANRAAMKILGIKPDQIDGTYGSSFIPDTPDAQRRLKKAFDSVGRGVDTSGVVLELRRKDNGKPIWIQWWSNPDKGGMFTRTMFIDITDKVLMEQEQAKLKAQNQYLQEEIKLNYNFEEIISKNKNFQNILQQIEQVASTDATVLILGESGTGKELIARAVHN
ncbi:MAG: PAS domain S-box protein, partial [Chitinophagaceae bacterium]